MEFRKGNVQITRNNENAVVGLKKEVARFVPGPLAQRAVLGKALLQRSASETNRIIKPVAPAAEKGNGHQAFDFKKPQLTKNNKKPAAASKPVPQEAKAKQGVLPVNQNYEADRSSTEMVVPEQQVCVEPLKPENMSVLESTIDDVTAAKNASVVEVEDTITALAVSFSHTLLTVHDIDADDKDNPQLVSEYAEEIYVYLRGLEMKHLVSHRYLDGQDVTPRMRHILIDWLVQVHSRFQLLQETLYLTIAIIDRYLMVLPNTKKEDLQLVGVTAMFVASKYEEMYCTEIGDFVFITDKAYSKAQIRRMEVNILKSLNYYISFPLPLHFLRRNSKAGQVDGTQHMLAKYLMELCLPDYNMCHFKASEIAAAALCVTMKLIGDEDSEWTDTLVFYSSYSKAQLMPIMCKMAQCITRSQSSKYQSVQLKYRSSRNMKISEIPELQGSIIRSLAEKAVVPYAVTS